MELQDKICFNAEMRQYNSQHDLVISEAAIQGVYPKVTTIKLVELETQPAASFNTYPNPVQHKLLEVLIK